MFNDCKNKMRKKIIISSYDDIKNPYYGGGGAVAIHELAKRLNKNYQIEVLSWNHSGVKKEIIDGVSYVRIGFPFLSPKISMLVFQILLPFMCYFKKYDFWLESFGPPFTASLSPLVSKERVVGIVNMLASEDMHRKYGKLIPFGILERLFIKNYKNIIVNNEYIKKKVLDLNPKTNVTVISNGVNRVDFKKFNDVKSKKILYLGRIEIDQKGLDLLVLAFKKFLNKAKDRNYQLVIAGSGAPNEVVKLKELIQKHSLKRKVVLPGRVEGRKKDNFLSNSLVLVITSRFETHPLVALEAMAYRLPIVCFDIEGLRWVSNKASIKVKPFDIDKFASSLELIALDRKTRQKLGGFGYSYAKKYTWEKIAQRYSDFIISIHKTTRLRTGISLPPKVKQTNVLNFKNRLRKLPDYIKQTIGI